MGSYMFMYICFWWFSIVLGLLVLAAVIGIEKKKMILYWTLN
jgi:hypothetical protein